MKLRELGEDGFLARLAGRVPPPGVAVRVGMGDDAAAVALPAEELALLSVDALVEGVHFTRETLPPRFIGRKVVAANVSDVAAMGGRPVAVLCSLFVSPEEEVEDVGDDDADPSRARLQLGAPFVDHVVAAHRPLPQRGPCRTSFAHFRKRQLT